MKKWNEPQIVDLNVECTKGGSCSVNANAKTQYWWDCDKINSDGSRAYTPKGTTLEDFNVECIYYGGVGICNYGGNQQS